MQTRMHEFFRSIVKQGLVLDFNIVVKEILRKGFATYREILAMKNVGKPRSVILRLIREDLVKREQTRRGTIYIKTSKLEYLNKLLDLYFEKRKPTPTISFTNQTRGKSEGQGKLELPKTILKLKVMEWVSLVLDKFLEEGRRSFTKEEFFRKAYEIYKEYKEQGIIEKGYNPRSLDRALRKAVELGWLDRSGPRRHPIYTITERYEMGEV